MAGALRLALEAYGGWVQCMAHDGGRAGAAEVERMLSALTVALPRAFCEATSKAFITALELPYLSTSFETFRHVRDRLLALQHHLSLYPMAPEHQRRVGCLNTLLYLRGG